MNDALNKDDDIFGYIQTQESNYKRPIPIGNKEWSMKDHIERSSLHRDSDIVGNKTKWTVIKNHTRPILNLNYRTEDVDVKDCQLYIDNKDKYHLSFLVKKYWDDVFTQKHDLDTFFDKLNQSRIDYGGGLSKRLSTGREVVPLQSIVFCDQTDILSGPIGIKHYYSPDQLLDMKKFGWGDTSKGATISVEGLIRLSREEKKDNNTDGSTATTPGRYIEIYEVHGNLPKRYFDKSDTSGEYETRLFIVAFYKNQSSDGNTGVILYTAPETKNPFKLCQRGVGLFGRALDFGGAEELFDDQMWINYAEMCKIEMLKSASKTILGAVGPNSGAIATKNNTNDLDNNEILDLGDGDLKQIDTFPRNMRLFDNFVVEREEHAKSIGAAQDPIQGAQPTAGTPFASLQAQIVQGMGLHDYRRGMFAKHIEDIIKDDYTPIMKKEITNGTTFLSELSLDELQYVTDCVVRNEVNKRLKDAILAGETPTEDQKMVMEELIRTEFKKKGNKHFIEILKGEFKDVTVGVKVSVAGKSKNLAQQADKLTSALQFVISTYNPQTGSFMALDDPRVASMVNGVLEASGLDPVDYTFKVQQKPQQALPAPAATPSPMQPQMQPTMQPQMNESTYA